MKLIGMGKSPTPGGLLPACHVLGPEGMQNVLRDACAVSSLVLARKNAASPGSGLTASVRLCSFGCRAAQTIGVSNRGGKLVLYEGLLDINLGCLWPAFG